MNTCIMCGEHGASKEDALPTWVIEMLKRTSEGPFASVRDGVMTPKTDKPRRIITRRPCQQCNEWRGNTFDSEAAPLLKPMMEHGQRTILTPAQQYTIACWVVKTTMMLRLTHTTRNPYPTEEYRQLRQSNGAIGHSWSVWIGAQTYKKRAILPNLPAASPPPIPRTHAPHYDGMTQAIGHLVMQVLYKRGREDRALQNGAELIGVVSRIWPVSIKSIVWPPRYVLTADDVRLLGTTIVV
jgi:hypothetical protein